MPSTKKTNKSSKRSTSSTIRSRGPNAYGPASIHSLAAAPRKGAELKWLDGPTANTQLYHNASNGTTAGSYVATRILTEFPNQGTTVTTRIGDRVFAHKVDVRLWLSNKADRPNVIYRVVAAIIPGYTSGTAPTFGAITGSGSGLNCLLAHPGSDVATFVYDRIVNPDQMSTMFISGSSGSTDKERSYYHEFAINLNENISVNSNNNCDISNILLYVVCYDAYGTLATDNIASYACITRMWFSDP